MRDWIAAVSVRMSSPATHPCPELGLTRPASILMVVVFPAPFGPRKPKISPSSDLERHPIHGDEASEAPGQLPRDHGGAHAASALSTASMNRSSRVGAIAAIS